MLKDTPKYLMSKATTLPTKSGGSKKKMAAQQNQINLEKVYCNPLQ